MRDPESITYFLRIFIDGIEAYETGGMPFLSPAQAWREAMVSTGEIIRDMDGKFDPGTDWRMDVTTAEGKVLYRLSFTAEDLRTTNEPPHNVAET